MKQVNLSWVFIKLQLVTSVFLLEYEKQSDEVLCVAIDAVDDCKFYYSYKPVPNAPAQITAEKEKSKLSNWL